MEFILLTFRFLIAFALAFVYGLQRQRDNKPIGFGTYIFVTAGSCGLALLTFQLNLGAAAIPLLGAIVTGIGFLGAGALIRNSDRVFGFTNAASIWLFAIFGMLIGLGQYLIGLTIYASIWFVVLFDNYLEHRGVGSYRRKIAIDCHQFVKKNEIVNILAKHCEEFHLSQIILNKREKSYTFVYTIEGTTSRIEYLIKELYSQKWCEQVRFE